MSTARSHSVGPGTGGGEAQSVAHRPATVLDPPYRTSTVGVVILITLVAFEAMAVATVLPTAARELNGLAEFGWAFTGFLIASIVGMTFAGWHSDRSGPSASLLTGLSLFVAGLLLASAAGSMPVLITARVIQGLACGLILTTMYVIMGEVYPDSLRPRIFAAIASAWVLPGLIGPVIAGWVTDQFSWRWVFGGLAPVAALGGALMISVLRRLRRESLQADGHRPRSDVRAGVRRVCFAVLTALGIAAVADAGRQLNVIGGALLVGGVVVMVLGLRPLVPAGTVTLTPGVPAAVALRGLLAGAFGGMETIVPLTLTVRHHYSPTLAGVPLMCSALSWAAGSTLKGRLRTPNRSALTATGLAMIAAAGAAMAAVAFGASGWWAFAGWTLAGFGAGLGFTSCSVVMLERTTDADRGTDSAALQLADSTMSALCAAFAGVLVAAAAHGSVSYGTALGVAFIVLAVLPLVSMLGARRLTK